MLAYRPEIDGLRALAVISVLFFHAEFSSWSGGFVGVDVFFVISGYLITSIIVNSDLGIIDFLKKFFESRLRRLFPPAVPVVLFSCIMAYWIFTPEMMVDFSKSLLSYLGFGSNWFFLSEAGYFSAPSQYKPLLHTWSLSVEEQFYFIFPLLFLFVIKYKKSYLPALVTALFVLSFGYSVYLVQNGNYDAAYFNSFGRFWEIMLGSLLALGVFRSPSLPFFKNLYAAAGGFMILYAVFSYDKTTPFPGFYALVPTVGAGLLILAGKETLVGRVLASRWFVFVGLISYSLYLWHWPIFVAMNAYFIETGTLHYFAGIAVSFSLSMISFYTIEKPIRKRMALPKAKHAYCFFAASCIALVPLGAVGVSTGGLPMRYQASELAILNNGVKRGFIEQEGVRCSRRALNEACVIGNRDVEPVWAILGDSHAETLTSMLSKLMEEMGVSAYLYTYPGCPFVKNIQRMDTGAKCYEFVDNVLEELKGSTIKNVLIHEYSGGYIHGNEFDRTGSVELPLVYDIDPVDSNEQDATQEEIVLGRMIKTHQELLDEELNVYYMMPVPEVGFHVPQVAMQHVRQREELPENDFSLYKERHKMLFEMIKGYDDEKFTFVPSYIPFCPDDTCIISNEGGLFYTDSNHLSEHGAFMLYDLLHNYLFRNE
ncbi:acyltransferase family protein [Halomonas sp. CSM-2]|uniref:acyltransferase family protein n=1 Tax=Halomonas sp. CSM-2 TaxID=1975722 RepID=UPI000A28B72C|nr:acyltransferase family protein [Halomonas sp. CSM-2]